MAEVPVLALTDLQRVVHDLDELAKGTKIFHAGQLTRLSTHGNKLFGEVKGSQSTPYRVTVEFSGPLTATARCTCPAAMGRPFCKHAAAIVVAWARQSSAFVSLGVTQDEISVDDVNSPSAKDPTESETDQDSKSSGATGNSEEPAPLSVGSKSLMQRGVEQVEVIVSDFSILGVAAFGDARREQLQTLIGLLRQEKLRKLSTLATRLLGLIKDAQSGGIRALAIATTLADMLLTARKVKKYIEGEPLENKYLDELVGKGWSKTDKTSATSKALVEYSFRTRMADDFIIRESRLIDVDTGEHFVEKQINPTKIKTNQVAKISYQGKIVQNTKFNVYPGFTPKRVDIESFEKLETLDDRTVQQIAEKGVSSVTEALRVFQELRKDMFAPPRMPFLLRVEQLVARGDRVRVADRDGNALFFPSWGHDEDRLWALLRDAELKAVLGDIRMDAAIATIVPMAVIVAGARGYELRTIAHEREENPHRANRILWTQLAEGAGVPTMAVKVAKIREELATLWVSGLASWTRSSISHLLDSLKQSGLDKPAQVLDSSFEKNEPANRLDDVVKVFQVLEVLLVRLGAGAKIDANRLEQVPGYSCVKLERPAKVMDPTEVLALRATRAMTRVEAAWHGAHYYPSLNDDAFLKDVLPMWADSAATDHVVNVLRKYPDQARDLAIRAMSARVGLTAKRTAVRVLTALSAETTLRSLIHSDSVAGLRIAIEDALDEIHLKKKGFARRHVAGSVEILAERLREATGRKRHAILDDLFGLDTTAVCPVLREVLLQDSDLGTREHAGRLLSCVGDPLIADIAVEAVESDQYHPFASVAPAWLGTLGDIRGVAPLLRAYNERKDSYTWTALQDLGVVVLDPLIQLIEATSNEKVEPLLDLLRGFADRDVTAVFLRRLDGSAGWIKRADLYLRLTVGWPSPRGAIARRIMGLCDEDSQDVEVAVIFRAAERALLG